MKIVEPYARLMPHSHGGNFGLDDGVEMLRKIEWCGRISHRSEDAVTPDSYDRFIRAVVLGHGDWSIVEHASASVDFLVDRGITHELVRHRLFSFTQESTRFVNYAKKMPPGFVRPFERNSADDSDWLQVMEHIEDTYRRLLHKGVAPQLARSVFPNSLASRIITTGNLRNWRHFFIMRTTKETHPQMREVSIPLLAEFQAKIPILFEDIEPEARQVDNLRKAR